MSSARSDRPITLVSFDIDGTLEVGDPPGLITIPMVRGAQRRGYVIGTCSDRPVSFQQQLWARLGMVPHFAVLKHRLADVKAQFEAHTYVHIGDTDIDDHFATVAGFHFIRADTTAHDSWKRLLFDPHTP